MPRHRDALLIFTLELVFLASVVTYKDSSMTCLQVSVQTRAHITMLHYIKMRKNQSDRTEKHCHSKMLSLNPRFKLSS